MEEYMKANLKLWNEWTEVHAVSEFYDVEAFKEGSTTLNAFELQEVGDVTGKTMLHLMSHFGMDTLSWARRGAVVTGVDFSDRALELASQLSDEMDLQAEFICSDIYELPQVLDSKFDIVYTSRGVLAWLPDLERWARVIGHFVKPGGFFYMAEFHPFSMVFDDSDHVHELRVAYPYFHRPMPLEVEVQGSYADRSAKVDSKLAYEWIHSMGDIVNSLIDVGLRLEFLHEYAFSVYPMYPSLMEEGEDDVWRLKQGLGEIPLMFSLKAGKLE